MTPENLAEAHRRHNWGQGETWAVIARDMHCSKDRLRDSVYAWRRAHEIPDPRAEPHASSLAPERVPGVPTEPPPRPESLLPPARDALLSQLVDAITATQDALQALDDRKPVCTIDLPGTKPAMVVLLSDLHIGGVGVDHRLMQEDFALIRATDGVWAGCLGDHGDQFSPAVIPKGMLEQILTPNLQWEVAELFLRRHLGTERLIFGVEGNHDAFSGAAGLTPCREMYRRLGVPYLGSGGRVWLKVGAEVYKWECRHDFPFKSSLNTTNSQRRLAELTFGADVVGLGHLHYPDLHYTWRGTGNQLWCRSGTYKRVDAYAEAKGYNLGYAAAPADMVGVILWPDSHRILPFRNFKDALPLLAALRGG